MNCPECGSKRIIFDPIHAESYCADCGAVIEENIIDSRERPIYGLDRESTKRIRTGPPASPRFFDRGLSSQSFRHTRTAIYSQREKALMRFLTEIDRQANVLKLPVSIKNEASALLHKAKQLNLTAGRSLEVSCAVLLYISCRQAGIPRPLNEFIQLGIPVTQFRSAYNKLKCGLGLKIKPLEPQQFIFRLASELALPNSVSSQAIQILQELRKMFIGGSPIGTAAAAIWLAITLSPEVRRKGALISLARASGASPQTIRRHAEKITQKLGIKRK